MEREEITRTAKAIKQHLRRRSGKSWSVRSDTRSTAYGSIYIEVPRTSYETGDYEALTAELGQLMGYHEPRSQISFYAREHEYLERAAGTLINPPTCGCCGQEEYRWKAPYCDRCQSRMKERQYN